MPTQDSENQVTGANGTFLKQLRDTQGHLEGLESLLWKMEFETLETKVPKLRNKDIPLADPSSSDSDEQPVFREVIKDIEFYIRTRRSIRAYLEEVEADIRDVHIHGWMDSGMSKKIRDLQKREELSQADLAILEQTSFALLKVGLGGGVLTYTTIFTATHGDIGYMAWAFSLFTAGTIAAMAILLLVPWNSEHPDAAPPIVKTIAMARALARATPAAPALRRFRKPGYWEKITLVILIFSVVFILAAIILMTWPLLILNPDVQVSAFSSRNSVIFMYSILCVGVMAVVTPGIWAQVLGAQVLGG